MGIAAHRSAASHAWLLTLVECMRSQWGCTLRQALFGESILVAQHLWPAVLSRHGVETTGDDPASKARRKAKREAREFIAANFEIAP